MAFQFSKSSSRSRSLMSEINVTPFVDVMLVLLIVFMVTAGEAEENFWGILSIFLTVRDQNDDMI